MTLIERLRILLSEFKEEGEISTSGTMMDISLSLKNLKRILILMKYELGFIQLVDFFVSDNFNRNNPEKRFQAFYILYNFELGIRSVIKVSFSELDTLPTVSDIWKNAGWCEFENQKSFNIKFSNLKIENRIDNEIYDGPYLRKDYQPRIITNEHDRSAPFQPNLYLSQKEMKERSVISVGPQWAHQRGSVRFWFEMEDEIICRSAIELGFIHRGIEKVVENKNANQIFHYVERLNYLCPSANSILWARAVEESIEVDIPERAKAIRMLFLEISRVIDHARSTLSLIERLQVDVGHIEFKQIVSSGERLLGLYSRQKYFQNLVEVGGVRRDTPTGWMGELMEWIRFVERMLFSGQQALISSPFWIEQNQVKGILASEAIEWGLSGPILRSCGVNFDLRRSEPFYFYQDVDFEIPLGINGTSYDHFLVKMEEMKQSLNILAQVADNMPVGDFKTSDPKVALGDGKKIKEGDLGQFARTQRIINIGPVLPEKLTYTSIEAPNGELGVALIGQNASNPYRLKWRGPSLFHLQPFAQWSVGMGLNDAKSFFESLNISISEIDR
ncbi:MAG: hypothetical protein Fur0010_14470 [Bdellovibrio sp.]